jgi:response regulator RpfG family c-di-GMP phosphodiesterase
MNNNTVLLVDDDQALLNGLKRQFHGRFNLLTALGGEEALEVLNSTEAVSTVVVDMQMPKINGVQLLEKVSEVSPDTTRIMLTGNADQQTAIDAVNKGKIFRFFNKPCDSDFLAEGIDAAIRQYGLVRAEKELLENTLAGSVKVLVDVLAVSDEAGYSRAMKVREWAQQVAKHLSIKSPWQLIMSATLFPIGNIVIPPELMLKQANHDDLTDVERNLVQRIPEQSADLIANIPRLKPVAENIRFHQRGFDGTGFPSEGPNGTDLPLGARILKILIDLETITHGASPGPKAFSVLQDSPSQYDPELLARIKACLCVSEDEEKEGHEIVDIPVSLLRPGYRLLENLELKSGRLILSRGTRLSKIQIERLRNFEKLYEFNEPIKAAKGLVH